jgi:hypothetical protein
MAVKDEFAEILQEDMNAEDNLESIIESEYDFGAFDNLFRTTSFNEQMDKLFPCGVSEENLKILDI